MTSQLLVPESTKPWLRLKMAATQNIANDATASLSWDTVVGSGGGWTAPGVPISQLTMPFTGRGRYFVEDVDWGDGAVAGTGRRGVGQKFDSCPVTNRFLIVVPGVVGTASGRTVTSISGGFSAIAGQTLFEVLAINGGSLATLAVAAKGLYIVYEELGDFVEQMGGTGTASTTASSATVTADSAIFVALGNSEVNHYIRLGGVWYRVTAVSSTTVVTVTPVPAVSLASVPIYCVWL